ncbi:hypothetical protein QVD17_36010 [Tagetes erecta]|uniref:Uncharacterized protein n=1 Tax=Tagetes erecta TaxID=13708 RepID=A0AAD8JTX8_TARER|nr:hypothetical protein QVD17_36010 [Tagetes erecta]
MKSQQSNRKKPINIVKIIKAPIRAICKALDVYTKCVTNFSNVYNRPLRTGVEYVPDQQRLPRSFTTSRLPDNNDQPPESPLVRSISAGATDVRSNNIKLTAFELYMVQQYQRQSPRASPSASPIRASSPSAPRKGEPRSCAIEMGKIDEDRASSFRGDNAIFQKKLYLKGEDDPLFLKSLGEDRVFT